MSLLYIKNQTFKEIIDFYQRFYDFLPVFLEKQ